jgi:hypothetical protein
MLTVLQPQEKGQGASEAGFVDSVLRRHLNIVKLRAE